MSKSSNRKFATGASWDCLSKDSANVANPLQGKARLVNDACQRLDTRTALLSRTLDLKKQLSTLALTRSRLRKYLVQLHSPLFFGSTAHLFSKCLRTLEVCAAFLQNTLRPIGPRSTHLPDEMGCNVSPIEVFRLKELSESEHFNPHSNSE